jgi:uncharacterized delta-60 repeat protein
MTRTHKSIFNTLRAAVARGLVSSVLMLAFAANARAQCLEGWLPGAGTPGVSGTVRATAVLPNGDIVVGGEFNSAGGIAVNKVARYNPTTGSWSALGSGLSGGSFPTARAFAVLPSGDLIVGGDFTSAGGVAANSIARYNPTTGDWAALGEGTNDSVHALAVLPDGDLIVAGSFTAAGSVAASRIARYNPTAGIWSILGAGLSGSSFSTGLALAVLPGGDLIVGGDFTNAGGIAARRIARLNPNTGNWSALGTGTSGTFVSSLAVTPSGEVIVGGDFTFAGGVSASRIARYNPNTGQWFALGAGVSFFPPNQTSVRSIAVLQNGDVIAGGIFYWAGGTSVLSNFIARFSLTTGTWSTLGGSGVGGGFNGSSPVYALTVLSGDQVIVGGDFSGAGGIGVNHIARYDANTGQWSPLGRGIDGTIYDFAVLPDGGVIAAGTFSTAGGVPASRIARYDPNTGSWAALGTGISPYVVFSLAALPDGDLIAGGIFNGAGGVSANNIARYNFATGVWSALGSGVDGEPFVSELTVWAIAVLPDGDILAGGSFTSAGGTPANNIARYRPSDGTWSALGSGVWEDPLEALSVTAIAVLPGGDVLVGGTFTEAGGLPAQNIARYNPVTNVWSALGAGTNGGVSSLLCLPDGDVVVGGSFTMADGLPANRIARYNPTTGAWSSLGTGTDGNVSSLALTESGDVIAGGRFTSAGSVAANNIARYSKSTNAWSALGSGTSDTAIAVAALPGGDVIAGGRFTSAGGGVSASFARYTFGSTGPSITTQPQSVSTRPLGSASFTVAAVGNGPLTYQWQVGYRPPWSPETISWSNLSDDGWYVPPLDFNAVGTMTPQLTLSEILRTAPLPLPIYLRCVVSDGCGSTTSDPAVLTICPADLNSDQYVDDADFVLFAGAYNLLLCSTPTMPAGCPADLDGDQSVDDADFAIFAEAYNEVICP